MSGKQQGKLLPMVKFREIIRLHELGYNQTKKARSCVVARSTVLWVRDPRENWVASQKIPGRQ